MIKWHLVGIVNEATYVLIDHYVFNAAPFSIIFTLCGPLFQLPYLYSRAQELFYKLFSKITNKFVR